MKSSYLSARITSVACFWNVFMAMALAVAEIAGRRIALFLILPSLTFVLGTTNFDFAFFSSEQFPSAISAWIVYLIARQIRSPRRWRVLIVGLLSGALPFCKIQVGPSGVLFFVASGCVVLASFGRSREALRWILIQCAGGLTVPVLILGPVAMAGALGEFYEFYIKTALSYRNAGDAMQKMDVHALIFAVREFGVLSLCLLGLAALGMTVGCLERRRAYKGLLNVGLLGFSGGYVLLSGASILRTGYPFPHYLVLLIVPGILLLGAAFRAFRDTEAEAGYPHPAVSQGSKIQNSSSISMRGFAVSGIAVGLGVAVQAVAMAEDLSKNARLLASWGSGTHPLAEVIRGQIKPGDTVGVWGWAPKFNVMAQVAPAFRFSQSLFLLDDTPWLLAVRPFFLSRFMSDFEKSRPRLFVDAPDEFLWPSYPHGVMARHWAVPVVSDFVRKNYSLIASIPSTTGKVPILLYKLKEESEQQVKQ
jgi:hypothetical protein